MWIELLVLVNSKITHIIDDKRIEITMSYPSAPLAQGSLVF